MIDQKIQAYNQLIKEKYEDGDGPLCELLSNPTASCLKRACVELLALGNRSDYRVLKRFFGFNEEGNIARHIEEYAPGRLKSITKFLNGESDYIKSHISLDLVAALVDLPLRPYMRFLKQYKKKERWEREDPGAGQDDEPDAYDELMFVPYGEPRRKRRRFTIKVMISVNFMVQTGFILFLTVNASLVVVHAGDLELRKMIWVTSS